MFREDNARKCVIRKELLGTGSFGSVYRGDWLKAENDNDKDVAIKIIAYSGDQIEKIGRELYFLKRFNSPFAVKYFDSFLYHYELWIVMELCDAGSLLDIFRTSGATLNESELKAVIACRYDKLLSIDKLLSLINISYY
jgi:serine/threonine protein kinase